MQKADFFNDRNAISDTISFFGRIELLDRLKEELVACQGIGLFGIRKSGKTSVLYQLSFLLKKNPVVRIDLQQYSGSYYGSILFNDIIHQLVGNIRKINPEYNLTFSNFPFNASAKSLVSEFINRVLALVEDLEKVRYQSPIIFLFDEMERVLPTPKSCREKVEEFNACFGALRTLCQHHRKAAILVTDVHPDCNRVNNWKQEDVATNPVFEFFKEIFLSPFLEHETIEMITGIGKFMGLEFDDETPKKIHQESGGHPFVARQLARFLSKKVLRDGSNKFKWSSLSDTLENSLFEFDELDNYFEKSIWEDFEKRKFTSAILILKVLAVNTDIKNPTNCWIERDLLKIKIGDNIPFSRYNQVFKRLVDIGILDLKKEQEDKKLYKIKMIHLSRWIRMQMTSEEINQWQI